MVAVMSFTVVGDSTAQCDTSSARAPAKKNARASPERASEALSSAAAVLQAERMIHSASSLSLRSKRFGSSPNPAQQRNA
jgi:hypothetical protein